MRAIVVGLALGLLACDTDPEPGSLADCEPSPAPDGIDDAVPPIDGLQAWLVAAAYEGYLPESAPHRSRGAHGGTVRTFVNRVLAESLSVCAESHPVGAAAVKELHTEQGLRGWAVMVKTRPEQGAASWFWYEVTDTSPEAEPAYSGQGEDTCTGCHDGGLDAVRTTWPLQ